MVHFKPRYVGAFLYQKRLAFLPLHFIMNCMTLRKAMLVGGVASIVANLILLYIGKPLVGGAPSFAPLFPAPVVVWSILGVLGAGWTFAFIRKRAENPQRMFLIVSGVFLVVSFIPDYMLLGIPTGMFSGASLGGVVLLMLMHVVEAAILVPLFLKTLR